MLDYSLLVGIHRLPRELSQAERQRRLQLLQEHGGCVSRDRQKVYFFGIIDVLERYNLRWRLQRLVLTVGYHLLLRTPDALGISALTPPDYAARFATFAVIEALQLSLPHTAPPQAAPPQPASSGDCRGSGSDGSWASVCGTIDAKWGHLWQRRRRGLVKMRIQMDREDSLRRIEELERRVAELERGSS